jgi:hypothetical protein
MRQENEMARKFSELREKMTPEAGAESDRLFEEALKEYPLAELRKARGLSQKMPAEALGSPLSQKWKKRRTCISRRFGAILRLWEDGLK